MSRPLGKATRDGFGEALRDLGAIDTSFVVLDGDVNNSTRTEYFAAKYPERFFNVGIAESNLVGIASGIASNGRTAWLASFAAFLMCNAFDQLRMAVAVPGLPVKCVGSHAGISIGEDGPSQMAIEDVALACALPGFTVVVPADEHAARAAVPALHRMDGPCYLRVGRPKAPVIYANGSTTFEIGRANRLRDGGDVTLIANGLLVSAALDAADRLASEGIQARVLDLHTVRPLDREALIAAAKETRGLVVAEEHLIEGGLGSRVAVLLAQERPCPMRFVGLTRYAESGKSEALLEKYHLTAFDIAAAARDLLRAA